MERTAQGPRQTGREQEPEATATDRTAKPARRPARCEVLGVEEGASWEEVKIAFNRVSSNAEERVKAIHAAYDVAQRLYKARGVAAPRREEPRAVQTEPRPVAHAAPSPVRGEPKTTRPTRRQEPERRQRLAWVAVWVAAGLVSALLVLAVLKTRPTPRSYSMATPSPGRPEDIPVKPPSALVETRGQSNSSVPSRIHESRLKGKEEKTAKPARSSQKPSGKTASSPVPQGQRQAIP
jgi:hypothetical protein